VNAPTEPRASAPPERVFYDGECGLCHRWVLFTLAREGGRELFRYAPLAGATFAAELGSAARARLPDSLIVRTRAGTLLLKSDAVLHLLERVGGGWARLAALLRCLPRGLRDAAYDAVARARRLLLPRPAGACPRVPPELARRFDP
jgi:predicted DCC family thiol-disulfide oxidoreductase YuxK